MPHGGHSMLCTFAGLSRLKNNIACSNIKGQQKLPFYVGASGDTELFEKASNINGFQGGRVANNLYISPFWATVFQTAALFLYPNSSAMIWVENLRFLSLWLAF